MSRKLLFPLWVALLAIAAGCRATDAPPASVAGPKPAAPPPATADLPVPPAPEAPVRASRPIDRQIAVETFDQAWGVIERTHFDPDYNGVDWHALRDELRPEAETAETLSDLRRVVHEMVGRLGQSHFALLPGDYVDAIEADDDELDRAAPTAQAGAADPPPRTRRTRRPPTRPGEVGIDVRVVDDQIVVVSVRPGSPADEAGIRPGWIVQKIGGRDLNRLIQMTPDDLDERMREWQIWQAASLQLLGEQRSEVSLTLLDENDEERVIELTRVPVVGEPIKFGDLPTFYAKLDHKRIESTAHGIASEQPKTIGYITLNVWMVPLSRAFDDAIDALRDADGIIIDLRGNPGGVAGMVMGVSGHFLDERVSLGTLKTRDTELQFVANPRRASAVHGRVTPYAGPLAILVDSMSGSTSEVFTGGMQGLGRARVFGQTSMGAALPAMMTPLPSGDVLLHAFADFLDPHGESLEGRGAVPDVPAPHTRESLLAGRDAALDAAVEWIVSQTSQNSN